MRARRNNSGGLFRLLGSYGVGCWPVSLRPRLRSLAVMAPTMIRRSLWLSRRRGPTADAIRLPFVDSRRVGCWSQRTGCNPQIAITRQTARLQVGSLLDDNELFRVPVNDAVN
jgi:hypothetical protein